MKKLTKPGKTVIKVICKNNSGSLKDAFVGLREVPLNELYPYLDLNEAIAFAVGSTTIRNLDSGYFQRKFVNLPDIFTVLPYVCFEGFRKLSSQRAIREALGNEKYSIYNPYDRKDFYRRLGNLNSGEIGELQESLLAQPKKWVFPDQFENEVRARGGEDSLVWELPFERVDDSKLVSAYAGEIAKLVSKY